MKKSLYLECFSGISGDMTVAALLDLGADETVLRQALESLKTEGFQINISRVKKSGLDACDFDVILDQDNHDHDLGYLHGHQEAAQSPEHSHQHHSHGHSHHIQSHMPHNHEHSHRGLAEILSIIEDSALTPGAKNIARDIFMVLAQAESQAHGVPVSEVHFHEAGAVDSIVDILSVAVCLDNLEWDEIIIPELWEGHGTVRCQHGFLPIPVPAVSNIVREYGLILHPTHVEGELVTPTGAAIAAAVGTTRELPAKYAIQRIGLGAGKRDYPTAGVLRSMLLTSEEDDEKDIICKLETNLDDCTGEVLGYVMELLLAAGARDVHYTPVFMKKNRPGYQLNVLCTPQDRALMEEIIFRETTSIGIRHMEMERTILPREEATVKTLLGNAQIKRCRYSEGTFSYPEYESAARIAREHHLPLKEVMDSIKKSI